MALVGAMLVLAGVWTAASKLWERLPRAQGAKLRQWLVLWAVKGLATPLLLWLAFNSGFSDRFPPLMIRIQMAAPGMDTVLALLGAAMTGLFIIGSYWAAMTLGWLVWVLEQRAEDRGQFVRAVLECSLFSAPPAALILWAFGWNAAGAAGVVWLLPVFHHALPLVLPPKLPPHYSRAIAKMHLDKFRDAELAVIEELEKSEEDFKGWMMLAELYANHFDDLAGAGQIVRDSCALPGATVSEICGAFQQLADWQLKLAGDPAAARASLEEICRRYPDTHMSRMARQRIEQLPRSREDWIESQSRKPIPLPALGHDLDHPAQPAGPPADRKQAAARANECVRKLHLDPDNIAVREELARILAERLGKAAPALEQLDLLLSMPGVPAEKAARWLALEAAWQIKYQGNDRAGRETLERIIRSHPESSQALAARRRITLMDMEMRIRAARAGAKVGTAKRITIPPVSP
ncbi:MAG: tetratricopeptide repeat protein [Verrucomicrobiota bacterium]|jgi:tetratricopeptide (TPR) repeat protein